MKIANKNLCVGGGRRDREKKALKRINDRQNYLFERPYFVPLTQAKQKIDWWSQYLVIHTFSLSDAV